MTRSLRLGLMVFFILIFGLVTLSYSASPTVPKRAVLAELFTATW
ncbi:MAG: hypothetical protein QME64_03135 [bacterium]|nr:hypothetical protein [bacterium]